MVHLVHMILRVDLVEQIVVHLALIVLVGVVDLGRLISETEIRLCFPFRHYHDLIRLCINRIVELCCQSGLASEITQLQGRVIALVVVATLVCQFDLFLGFISGPFYQPDDNTNYND